MDVARHSFRRVPGSKEAWVALILTRMKSERIVIGDNIVVEVQRIQGKRVSLAIHAPKETKIHRGELTEKKP